MISRFAASRPEPGSFRIAGTEAGYGPLWPAVSGTDETRGDR
jgi:hypothetical protein